MKIEVCFSPILYPFYCREETIVVAVDVFRATSTMCAAMANGAKSIISVATLEEAIDYKNKGFLVGGERNVKRVDFADFGNTPEEYTSEKVEGKDIVLTTTNGTRAIELAKNSYKLIIGAFSNISSVTQFCASEKKDVIVLCSGWKDKVNIEDTLFGGALADKLSLLGFETNSDATQIALSMWTEAKADINKYMEKSEHIKRLAANNLLDVGKYCLIVDTLDVLPVYNKETNKIERF